MANYFDQFDAAPAAPAGKNFFDQFDAAPAKAGVIDTLKKAASDFVQEQQQRGAKLNDIVNATKSGQQSLPEGVLQGAMNEVGAGADAIGAGVAAPIKAGYAALPAAAQAPIDSAMASVGKVVAPVVQAYNQNLNTYNAQNPRAGRNFEAIREGANLLPLGSSGVRDAAGAAVDTAANAAKDVAMDTGKGIANKIGDIVNPDIPLTSDEGKDVARYSYKMAEDNGGLAHPQVRQNLINDLKANLPSDESLKPGGSVVQQVLDKAQENAGKPLSLEAADSIDKSLTDVINGEYDNKGSITDEGRRLQNIQSNFRNQITNPAANMVLGNKQGFEAYSQGVKNWSASKKLEDIEAIQKRASMTDNPATSIKAGFKNLANNKNRMRGYTDEEKDMIEGAAKNGVISDMLRTTLGSRLISGGLGATAGAFVGGPVGTVLGGIAGSLESGTSRKMAEKLATAKVTNLKNALSSRIDIPKDVYSLPPVQAKAQIQKMLALPAPRPDPVSYGSGQRLPKTAELMDQMKAPQPSTPIYAGAPQAPLALPAPGYIAPSVERPNPIAYGTPTPEWLNEVQQPYSPKAPAKPLALPNPNKTQVVYGTRPDDWRQIGGGTIVPPVPEKPLALPDLTDTKITDSAGNTRNLSSEELQKRNAFLAAAKELGVSPEELIRVLSKKS